jgi:phosphatidate cytidylyltransferase
MPDLATGANDDRAPRLASNLKLRIVSGIALAAIAFGLAYAGAIPFAILVLLCALAMSWEWGRLVRGTGFDLGFFIHACAVAGGVVLAASGYAALGVAVLASAAITLVPLYFGRGARLSALGVFYVGLPSIALLWVRGDAPFGFTALLFIFAVVWSSDTLAYASGRLIGGPKLWPAVSPNKTWAGLIGALTAGAISGAVFAALEPDSSMVRLIAIGVGMAFVAQAGDLAESALKRHFHSKDASDLIPGHGGFMDRMDALVAVAVACALLALVVEPHAPARALLFGF